MIRKVKGHTLPMKNLRFNIPAEAKKGLLPNKSPKDIPGARGIFNWNDKPIRFVQKIVNARGEAQIFSSLHENLYNPKVHAGMNFAKHGHKIDNIVSRNLGIKNKIGKGLYADGSNTIYFKNGYYKLTKQKGGQY